jgi:NADP-dependent aldehyde dehydrogenase
VVKAHSAHPSTSRETSRVVIDALREAGAPEGVFGIVYGTESGRALVQHPSVRAVGFTGSTGGGRALFDLAQGRPDPIPFYGELGSVNPTVILPGAATPDIAAGFAQSLTMGVGQFCTNPGLVFAPAALVPALGEAVAATAGGAMLNERMCDSYKASTDALAASDLVSVVSAGTRPDEAWAVSPRLFSVPVKVFEENLEKLTEEHFGPAALVVTYSSPAELHSVLAKLPGTLTGTVHAAESDHAQAGEIAEILRRVAGRLIFNAWPTGVAVAWGQHHGGPWPSTTNPLHTSVGATSIRRWIAPVTYQSWPDALLPVELRDANPLGIPRRVDGVLGVH